MGHACSSPWLIYHKWDNWNLLACPTRNNRGSCHILEFYPNLCNPGWVCRFQATHMQIATCGPAYFTVTIAVHTFSSLVLIIRQSVVQCRSTMIIGWIFAISLGLIPFMIHMSHGHVYRAVRLACSVRSVYRKTQFFCIPILIGSFLSVILYSLVFLAFRGTLNI